MAGHHHRRQRCSRNPSGPESGTGRKERPTLIIGHTLMGKGAVGANEEDFSNKVSTHGQPLSAAGASFENTVANLGGDPQNPFVIFPDVQEYYAQDWKRNGLRPNRKKPNKLPGKKPTRN